MTSLEDDGLCGECRSSRLHHFLSRDSSGDVNLPFASSLEPPLHVFVKHGHVNAVRYLQDNYNDLDVNKQDYCGFTPLHHALDSGHVEIASLLMSSPNCDVNRVTTKSAKMNGFDLLDSGASTLHMAIQVKHNIRAGCLEWDSVTEQDYFEVARGLCDRNIDCNIKTSHGRTAGHYAVMYGDQEDVVELLADYRADFEITDSKQHTPLLCAVAYSKPRSVKALIENGAKVNARLGDQTALHILFDKELDKMINYDIASLLINAGCPVNASDGFGDTVLHIAVCNENLNAVKFLLEHGVDSNVHYGAPHPRLSDALDSDYPEVASVLRERLGPRVGLLNVPETESYAPLYQVMFMNDEGKIKDFCDVFMSAGMSVNAQSDHGKTLLMLAIAQQRIPTAQYLLSLGADVNLCDAKGWNVLHVASLKFDEDGAHLEFYEDLIGRMDDVNIVTNRQSSALHIAAYYKKSIFIEKLLKAGASPHLRDDNCDKPLDIALGNGDLDSCVLLLSAGDHIDPEMTELYQDHLKDIEETLMLKENKHALYVFLSCGYKFHIEALLDKLDLDGKTCLESAEMVLKSAQNALPLKRQSANVIIRKVNFNGWVGVNRLDFPPGVKELLKSYIIMKNV